MKEKVDDGNKFASLFVFINGRYMTKSKRNEGCKEEKSLK